MEANFINKKVLLIFVFSLILILSVSFVSASDTDVLEESVNDTYDLNTNINDLNINKDSLILKDGSTSTIYVDGNLESDGDGSDTTPYNNLKSALSSASEGNVIIVRSGTYSGSNNIGLTISTSNLKIQAESDGDVIFDGKGSSQIFTIAKASKSVSLTGLTFINGYGSKGGAINWKGQSGTITNCVFINNTASNGGAIYFTDNAKGETIINSRFINNIATVLSGKGGAIHFEDEGEGNNKITDSTFIGNSATKSGGAVFLSDDGDDTIASCIFEDNFISSSSGFGGAIHFTGDDVNIIDSNFTNNYAPAGGAVYSNGRRSVLSFLIFKFNNASSGGALYLAGSGTTLSDSSFESNKADTGSAIYNLYSLTVTNTEFSKNQAKTESLTIFKDNGQYIVTLIGGDNILNAIYNTASVNLVNINGSNPVEGAENSNNGDILYQDSRISGETVSLSAYDGNTLVNSYTGSTDILGNVYLTASGNRLVATHSESNLYTGISNTYSSGNSYTDLLNLISSSILNGVNEISLTQSYTYDNVGDSEFPVTGILIDSPISINGNGYTLNGNNMVRLFDIESDNVSIYNLNIINHLSDSDGGAIYWNGENAVINNVNFTNNKVTGTFSSGGAVYFNKANGRISSSKFESNGGFLGGAIYINDEDFIISSSSFISNAGTGAVYLNGANGVVFDSTFSFSNNTGLYVVGANSNISSNSFISNNGSLGGALFVSGEGANIISNTFNTNYVDSYGGAIYSSSNGAVIKSNIFNSNIAGTHGGALYIAANTTLTGNTDNKINSEYLYIADGIISPLKLTFLNSTTLTVNQGSLVNIDMSIVDDNNNPVSGGVVKFTLNNQEYTTDIVKNGTITYKYNAVNSGNFQVTGTYSNSDSSLTVNHGYLNVLSTFYMTIITNGTYTTGSQAIVTVNIYDPSNTNPNGNVTLYLNGTSYGTIYAVNGIASFTISLPNTSGAYTLTAVYNDGTGDKISSRSLGVGLNSNDNGGNIGPVRPGGWNNTPGRPDDNPINTATQTVLNCNNYTQIESLDEGGYYTGKLTDLNGNAIVGQHISLTLTRVSSGASKTYDVITDYNGEYKLNIRLASGEYSIKASYAGLKTDNLNYASTESNTASIIITKGTPVSLKAENYISTYPGDGIFNKNFTGYLTYTNGTALSGRHISLTLTRVSSGASKTYDTVCDYTGMFILQITLAPGDYTVLCSFTEDGFEPTSTEATMTIIRT